MAEDPVSFLDVGAANTEVAVDLRHQIERVLADGQFIGGPGVRSFEDAWAAYCESSHAVGTGNGFDALHLLLRAHGIGPGDRVVVPSMTFIATWLAVSELGAEVLPVEIDPASGALAPDALANADLRGVRAVVAVHLYGLPADMAALRKALPSDVLLFEDAAQAHGARDCGRRVGSLANGAAWSFYPAKNLGALGDAGGVTVGDGEIAARVRMLGNYGAKAKYHHDSVGRNSRLDPVQAVALLTKLRRLDHWNERRRAIAATYTSELRDLEWLKLPAARADSEPVWHVFSVRLDRREALREHLHAKGIETGLHYPEAPHRSGAYAGSGFTLPVAERMAATCLSLPIGPHLDENGVDRVIAAVRSFDGGTSSGAR